MPRQLLCRWLTPIKPKGKLLQDYGGTSAGDIWIGYRLTSSSITSGVVTVPARLQSFMGHEDELADARGLRLGRLATEGGRAWSLSSLFRRKDLEAGDYLELTFLLNKRVARAKWEPEPPWELPRLIEAETAHFDDVE